MSVLERFERIGKFGLIGIFFCSTLLFGLHLFIILYDWNHMNSWKNMNSWNNMQTLFPLAKLFWVSVRILFFLGVFLAVWRYLHLKTLTVKNPSLRLVLKDEHTRTNWLKAFRPAFFLLLTIQLASKIPIMIWHWPWEIPAQSSLSLSAAVMALTGAFLFYNRGSAHE